ncbi:hypothetical protein BVRB_019360, partial [Beta vulgaris subsp. vulgaris]
LLNFLLRRAFAAAE